MKKYTPKELSEMEITNIIKIYNVIKDDQKIQDVILKNCKTLIIDFLKEQNSTEGIISNYLISYKEVIQKRIDPNLIEEYCIKNNLNIEDFKKENSFNKLVVEKREEENE